MSWLTGVLWVAYFLSLFFAVFWLQTFFTEPSLNSSKKLKEYPFVSIVIPAFNEEGVIEMTLKCVSAIDYPKSRFEIIVVNDGSTDRTESIVKRFVSSCGNCVLMSQKNLGKGAALNSALKCVRGEFFVCLDADSFPDRDCLLKLLPRFSSDDIAVVLPSMKVSSVNANMLQKVQHYEYVVNMFYKELMARLDCVSVAPGPFSVYRVSVLKKVGGFDEHNLTEDLEIALRLQENNYKLVQILDTNVSTVAPSSLKELLKQRNRWYKGSILNSIKHRKLLFNKSYGDFGMMQMPTKVTSGAIAIVLLFSTAYYLFKPLIAKFHQFFLIDFDMLTYLKMIRFDINWLDWNFTMIFVGVAMTLISFYILKKSHVLSKEKILGKGFAPFIFYLVLYFFVIGFTWAKIAVDLAIGRRQKW